MTVIAAIKKAGKVAIGSDSFWGDQHFRLSSVQSDDTSKLIDFKNFVVAIAGHGTLRDACQILAQNESKKGYLMRNKADARAFSARVYKKFIDLIDRGTVPGDPKEAGQHAGFIIATPTNIFIVYSDFSCRSDNFVSLGAGSLVCEAAMNTLVSNFKNLSAGDILRMSLKTACDMSNMCSEPITIREVT